MPKAQPGPERALEDEMKFDNLPQFKKLNELDKRRIYKMIEYADILAAERSKINYRLIEIAKEQNELYKKIENFWSKK